MALTNDLGLVTAYGYAKAGGYTGTEAEFETMLANLPTYASEAADDADRAEDAADRAEQIVGGQFVSYGGDQGLSAAQKEQARKNIAAGGSNYNLFDNSWFLVNSRGQSTYEVTGGYTFDRWYVERNIWQVTKQSYGIRLTRTAANYNPQFRQTFETPLPQGTYTISAIYRTSVAASSDIYKIVPSNTVYLPNSNNWTYFSHTFTVDNDTTTTVGIQDISVSLSTATVGDYIELKAVKLEVGSASTLANDTPPDYGEELTRCIYSTADPADSYANNGFGRSNKNLLDNWYLAGGGTGGAFPINQRGAAGSSVSTSGYFIDRWHANGANQVGIFAGYVRILANGGMRQYLPLNAITKGAYTVSVMLEGGAIYSSTGILDPAGTDSEWQISKRLWDNGIWNGVRVVGGRWDINLTSIDAANVVAVKLEKGGISTLANDAPPDYATELAKCQRYFVRVPLSENQAAGFGFAQNTTSVRIGLPLEVAMRAAATVTYNGSLTVRGYGSSLNVTALNGTTPITPRNSAFIACTVSGATTNQCYALSAGGSAYIDLSADL